MKSNRTEFEKLRQKAEELQKKGSPKTVKIKSEADVLKLLHEGEVLQIELRLQNEELMLAQDYLKQKNDLEIVNIELKLQFEEIIQEKEKAIDAAGKYTSLYDKAPVGYFTLTKDGEITEINIAGAEILCKNQSRLKGSRFGFFVSDISKPRFNSFLENIYTTGKIESCELILSLKENFPKNVFITGIVADKGEEYLITMSDITKLRQAEADLVLANNNITDLRQAALIISQQNSELKILNSDKDRFISILGHDLKSPFNGLLNLSELLVENIHTYDIKEIEIFAGHIHQSARTTYDLLEDILIWAKGNSGKGPFNPEELKLNDICIEILKTLNQVAESKNIRINYSETDNISVFADIHMLQTIIRNIVSNAIKFTKNNGSVNISAQQKDLNILISISDSGIGISPSDISKLFDISQGFTTKGTAEETGTGLGLLICKDFVERHGGKIWIESELGKGSDFYFTIPVKK